MEAAETFILRTNLLPNNRFFFVSKEWRKRSRCSKEQKILQLGKHLALLRVVLNKSGLTSGVVLMVIPTFKTLFGSWNEPSKRTRIGPRGRERKAMATILTFL